LLANYLVSKISNKKLVYDSHELFTEVPELIKKPKVKNIWLKIEKIILPKLKNNYTVCQSIADYYYNKYQTKFKVVRNIPLLNHEDKLVVKPYKFSFNTTNKKIILYQGAINIGRGLELMIDTMPFLENYIFVIIGDGDIISKLKQLVTKQALDNKVKFLGKISPDELKNITPLANLGISIEEDLGLNYRYALPNKIFDYIHAMVPVLVSDLPEMKLIVEKHQIGEVVTNRNPKELALQIEKIIKKDQTKIKQKLKQAVTQLRWGNEEKILKKIFTDLT
jgi:glycosyltransferase involved in cell wall biosynthesis